MVGDVHRNPGAERMDTSAKKEVRVASGQRLAKHKEAASKAEVKNDKPSERGCQRSQHSDPAVALSGRRILWERGAPRTGRD